MPKEGQEAANLTQDYTNSPLHRFKKPGSKNFQVTLVIFIKFLNIFALFSVLNRNNRIWILQITIWIFHFSITKLFLEYSFSKSIPKRSSGLFKLISHNNTWLLSYPLEYSKTKILEYFIFGILLKTFSKYFISE